MFITQLHFYHAPLQTLSLLKIERLKEKKTGNAHHPLWLIWVGKEFLSLEKIWSQYSRRFGVDHWYRFAKQGFSPGTPSPMAKTTREFNPSKGSSVNDLIIDGDWNFDPNS